MKTKRVKTFKDLNDLLVKHYSFFNTEMLYLDQFDPGEGICSVVYSSPLLRSHYTTCLKVAKFIKKHIEAEKFKFLYVGQWFFQINEI